MRPLHLAVDARVAVEDTRGIGRYARAILRRLVEREDVELTMLVQGLLPFRQRARYERALGSDRFRVASHANRANDCVWHPANGTFFASSLPSVVTIHDAVPFRYPAGETKRREHAQAPFLRSAQTATRVITVSHFAAGELHELLGLSPERVTVIPHGVETSFSPGAPIALPERLQGCDYFLFVGDPIGEPRKNFDLLNDAYRRAWPHGDGPVVAIAGPRAPELPGIVGLGDLGEDLIAGTPERLRDCYRGALALVLPSYHETFGMPMLEAMACGAPVVASAAGSLPEVGGGAALYAPAHDAVAWANALTMVAENTALRERLRGAGLERSRQFNWDDSALRHLDVFRGVV
ncbi:MAG: glycosyltransferase family 4 protein [Candidatus Eremiobacteraeota bacterium]|nr:glycosyltransferase family 4 protein [Candidatus Eremiobacteraeota bacterium]MBV9263073.1 glycosyltransferase family 4 protein [Candidatus Eremiobacteraeota bacterium]